MDRVQKIVLLAVAAAVVIGAVAAVVFLNNSGGGLSASEQKLFLANNIKRRLPSQLERIAHQPVRARRVTCVETSGDRYECVARVQPKSTHGNSELTSLVILGSCDQHSCVWHSQGEGGGQETSPTPAAETESAPAPASGLDWGSVTCGEVDHAIKTRELEWLAAAGEAVAYEALASLPDGNQGKLITTGARDLVFVCRQVSNPSYQPYAAAAEALLTGRRP